MQWYPLKNETPRAYQAFCVYVVMHDSPLSDIAKALRLKVFTLQLLMKEHNWTRRKEAFLRNLLSKGSEDMHKRHIQKAIALQEKAIKKFEQIEPENLSNSEVIRFLTAGANLERLARKAFDEAQEDLGACENDWEKIESFLEENSF